MRWKDELKNNEFVFEIVDVSKLVIPQFQRDLSNTLVKKLVNSIDKVGFIVPPVVVENDGKFLVIDGQHRVEAAKMLGYKKLPVVIVPNELKDFILTFNVEKPSNLKDKSKQAYRLFKEYLKIEPEMSETEFSWYIEQPYYLTVGIALEELNPKFSGSIFENWLKKVDAIPFELSLEEVYPLRKQRAQKLVRMKEKIDEIFEELGWTNHLLKTEIFRKAFQKVYGKNVRSIEDEFDESYEKLYEALDNVKSEFELEKEVREDFSDIL